MRQEALTKVTEVLNRKGLNYRVRITSKDQPYYFKVVIRAGYVGDSLKEIISIADNFVHMEVTHEGLVLS